MNRLLSLGLILLAALVATACSSSGDNTAPPAQVSITPDATLPAGVHAAKPAPIDGDYRPDSAEWVANTGRPQLLEVFSYD